MVVSYLKKNNDFGLRIEISREEVLLDTGGGLKKAAWFFLEDRNREPFVVHNADVISAIDLIRMLEVHKQTEALATLAVQARPTSRYLLFDEKNSLCGRRSGQNGTQEMVRPTEKIDALAFSGIHVISPRLLTMMNEDGVFSIITTYLRLAAQNQTISAFRADEYYWRDLGKPENITQAQKDVETGVVDI